MPTFQLPTPLNSIQQWFDRLVDTMRSRTHPGRNTRKAKQRLRDDVEFEVGMEVERRPSVAEMYNVQEAELRRQSPANPLARLTE